MSIIFTQHAKQRFTQRVKLPIGAGYKFARRALDSAKALTPYAKKYAEKESNAGLTVKTYKHLIFVMRIDGNTIYIVTVMLIH